MNTTDITRLFDRASDNRRAEGAMSRPDLDRYRPYVAHLDIPEARKDDMILSVWRIMQNAVDRAFGDDPVQQSGALADKVHGKGEVATLPVIESQDKSSRNKTRPLDDTFHRHAIEETDKEEKNKP